MSEQIVTEEMRITLIKQAIKTEDGWVALAMSLNGKPIAIKEECIRLLNKIGEQKRIDIPMTNTETNGETMSVDFSDLLVHELEKYIRLLSIEFV